MNDIFSLFWVLILYRSFTVLAEQGECELFLDNSN
jgi:hypothetical protein